MYLRGSLRLSGLKALRSLWKSVSLHTVTSICSAQRCPTVITVTSVTSHYFERSFNVVVLSKQSTGRRCLTDKDLPTVDPVCRLNKARRINQETPCEFSPSVFSLRTLIKFPLNHWCSVSESHTTHRCQPFSNSCFQSSNTSQRKALV